MAKLGDASLPSATNKADVLAIFDIRSITPGVGDSAVVRFRFLAGPDNGRTPMLQFLNTTTGKLQDFTPGRNESLELTRQGKFIVGTLRLDNASTPTLRQLTRTVFTISVGGPSAAATATVSASVASSTAGAAVPVTTATFRTTSQLTLALEPTQAGQVSGALSSVDATSSSGGGPAATSPATDPTSAALASFLVDEVKDGVQAVLPFAQLILLPSAAAPTAPGKPTALRQDESLRDACDFLFRELASAVSQTPSNLPASAAPAKGTWRAADRDWTPQSTSSNATIERVAVLAGLALIRREGRREDDRTKRA